MYSGGRASTVRSDPEGRYEGETKLKILELLRFSQLTGDIAALTSDSLTLLIT